MTNTRTSRFTSESGQTPSGLRLASKTKLALVATVRRTLSARLAARPTAGRRLASGPARTDYQRGPQGRDPRDWSQNPLLKRINQLSVTRFSGREAASFAGGARFAASAVDVRGEGADRGEVAVATVVVQAVTHDELVRDVEPDVAHLDRHLLGLRLAEGGHDLQAGGVAAAQVADQVRQGQAGVDDVLDDQHVPAGDVGVQVLEDPDHPGGLGARAVRRDRHPIHP